LKLGIHEDSANRSKLAGIYSVFARWSVASCILLLWYAWIDWQWTLSQFSNISV
jgi:hypothetical protein